jgi:hypothetical protein
MSLKNLLTDLQSYYQDYTFSQKYPANSEYATKPQAIAEGTFDQKSIPYGFDRPGGGWSGQPFITVPFKDSFGLPLEDIGGVGLNNDLFIRGGASVAKHIKDDEIRIGKFLKSTQGVLFAAQQNLLIKSSPVNLPLDIYPVEVYNPLNTLTQIAGNAFGNHTNKLGLNPFLYDLPHGQGQNSYLVKTKDKYNKDNTNRLTLLYQSKIQQVKTSSNVKVSNDFGIKFNDDDFIINTTLVNINRATNTTLTNQKILNPNYPTSNFSTFTSKTLSNTSPKQSGPTYIATNTGIKDFRTAVPESTKFTSFLAKGNYSINNRQSTFGMSDPGLKNKDVSDISSLSSGTPDDKINISSIYKSSVVSSSLSDSDLIPFYFQVVNNDDPSQYEFIHFRAYLDNFNDNFTGNWQPFKYSGRGENFYIYDGFQRNISFGFTIAIESRAEQSPQYQKINYLASLTAPDYAQNSGFMRGCFVKMTVGDYLIQVPGFLTSVNYTIANNIPWDIARGVDGKLLTNAKILPTVISANVSFTPVHSFVPKKGADFISTNNAV